MRAREVFTLKRIVNLVSVIGCPRSGTTILFNILSSSEKLWSLYTETDYWPFINPESDVLTAGDVTQADAKKIIDAFCSNVRNYEGNEDQTEIRIVEKQPRTCLTVDYIDSIFPGACYVFIVRDGRNVINSLMDAWHKGQYNGFFPAEIELSLIDGRVVNSWWGPRPPGWKNYTRARVVDLCAMQWVECNQFAVKSLSRIDPRRVFRVRYEDLCAGPESTVREICRFLSIPFSSHVQEAVSAVFKSDPGKWKTGYYKRQIESVLDKIGDTMELMGYSL